MSFASYLMALYLVPVPAAEVPTEGSVVTALYLVSALFVWSAEAR